MYQPETAGAYGFPVNKVVCVGNKYADHIKEMGSQVSASRYFIKPERRCAISVSPCMPTGLGAVHYEVELAVLIGTPLKQATEDRVANAIAGYGLALDLTLRDLQTQFKAAGQPWEKAKGFDGSCPVSGFIPVSEFGDAQQTGLRLLINGEIRQEGNTRDMLTPIVPLIAYMSRFFTLRAGDIILTGTPHGVGPLNAGDEILATLNDKQVTTRVI